MHSTTRDIINTMPDITMQLLENFGAKNTPPGLGQGVFCFWEAALSDERHQNDEGDDRHQDGKQGAAEVDEVYKLIEGFLFALPIAEEA